VELQVSLTRKEQAKQATLYLTDSKADRYFGEAQVGKQRTLAQTSALKSGAPLGVTTKLQNLCGRRADLR
jgi:hypothetical protein